ncbi:MAG: DNA repair protein RecN [Bacteroidota bacterium]
MIKSLKIKNFVLIESQEITFSDGLTIITGETGAGKSILLGALGLIMGNRADTKALYNENEKCVIEATFDLSKYDLKDFFEKHDIDFDTELFIRREITPSGKSRAFVNDTPANLKVLQALSAALIDLHQQFDTLDIHDNSFQIQMIDALADNKSLLKTYQTKYYAYQADQKILAQLKERDANASKELDFIEFQWTELEEADLEENEQGQLEEELALLTNAELIKRTLSGAFQHLSESEQSLTSQLQELSTSFSSIKKFDKEIASLSERIDGLLYELQDVSSDCENLAEKTELDPERIQVVQDRLDLLYRLQTKHQVQTNNELIAIREDLNEKRKQIGDLSNEIQALEEELKTTAQELREQAKVLRKNRKTVFDSFEKKVQSMLTELSMKHAVLKVDLEKLDELNSVGLDAIQFLFAANKGGRLQPIRDVASGGELSRLALVTKSLVASAIPLPTLIFDEIDTGISGDVALKMGNILRKLSNGHQVVSITHSPQVASKANKHYYVYKQVKGEKTITQVKSLDYEDRIMTIATMLSQDPPSRSAIDNARELLANS